MGFTEDLHEVSHARRAAMRAIPSPRVQKKVDRTAASSAERPWVSWMAARAATAIRVSPEGGVYTKPQLSSLQCMAEIVPG